MAQPKNVSHVEIERLLDKGELRCGPVEISFASASGDRLVVGFFIGDDKGAWLRETCVGNGFKLIALTAPTLDDFDAIEVSALLQAIAAHTICTKAVGTSLCASGPAAHAAIKAAQLFSSPHLIGFDLPLAHEPKDTHALTAGLAACQSGFVFYDPFHGADALLRDASKDAGIQWLKGFGLLGATLNRLWRMKLLANVLPAALSAELQPTYFYKLMRSRRNYRFYRTGIESALAARGQKTRQRRFRTLFRTYLQSQDPAFQFSALQRDAMAARPANADAWTVAGDTHADQDWPSVAGNVWMLEAQDDVMRYLSDRWHGVTMGYEERAGVTLAQTGPLALGMVSFGHGTQVARVTEMPFAWHVVTSDLNGHAPAIGAAYEATCLSSLCLSNHNTMPTVMTFAEPKSGMTAPEETRGTPAYSALLADLQKGREALATWDKTLHVDRLRLSLLSGSPDTPLAQASAHYGAVAHDLITDIQATTDQLTPPVIVVMQSAGSRSCGNSEVILAEGRVDLDNPALPVIVASPAYPWGIMEGTTATPSVTAAMRMDELSMHAVLAHQDGQRWFCPMMRRATVDGHKITVEFATLAGLHLDDGPHGFHILGDAAAPKIIQVQVTGNDLVTLEIDSDIGTDQLSLAYAWGHETPSDGYVNHGSLRDLWTAECQSPKGTSLHRFALAGCVPIRPTNR